MKTVSLTIDGKKITALEGEKVLRAALNNGIYIPNLCSLPDDVRPFTACRLCFVEIDGSDRPVTACSEVVAEGMVVNTRNPRVLRLARTGFELLMASHPVDCGHCGANRFCELQKIAAHLGVKLNTRRFPKLIRELPKDDSHPEFIYEPAKCVLCGRCVRVCRERLGSGALGFAHRGFERMVTTFGDMPLAKAGCNNCGDCVIACPTGALVFKDGQGKAVKIRAKSG